MDSAETAVPLATLLAHRSWVRGLARSLVADENAADDVVQQTWLAAMRRPPRDESTAKGWLARVVRNFARENRRAEGRRRRREEDVARSVATPGTDEVVAQAEQHKQLVLALMDLDEPYRTTVLLRFYEGLPPRDVSARMGVPVETVRTRTRRALAQLRERLDADHGGDRERWRAALILFSRAEPGGVSGPDPETPTDAPPRDGAPSMFTPLKLTVAAVLVAGGFAVFAVNQLPGDDPVVETAGLQDTDRPGSAGPRPRGADRGEVGGDLADDLAPAAEEETPPGPADDAAPAVTWAGDGDLVLSLSTRPEAPVSGEDFVLIARFRNVAEHPLRLFLPMHAGSIPFPAWRVRAEDGTIWLPQAHLFQSGMGAGLIGSLIDIAPGASHDLENHFAGFVQPDPETGRPGDWAPPVPLRPGRYVIEGSHANELTALPHFRAEYTRAYADRHEQREVEGVWTGNARADDVALVVTAPAGPVLTVDSPAAPGAAEGHVARLRIDNHAEAEAALRGVFSLVVHSKAGPTAETAYLPAGELVEDRAEGAVTLRIPSGGAFEGEVDLTDFTWTTIPRRWDEDQTVRRAGLYDIFGHGIVALTVRFDDARGEEHDLVSDLMFVRVAPLPDLADSGLRLIVEARPSADGAGIADVTLVNERDSAVRVPGGRLAPGCLRFELTRTEGGPAHDPSEGTRKTIERLRELGHFKEEHPDPRARWVPRLPGDEAGFGLTTLPPGGSLHESVELGPLVGARLRGGTYKLVAVWENAESGRRHGLESSPAVLGVLRSAPVRVELAGR